MASTYKPSDAIVYAKQFIKSMPIDTAASSAVAYQLTDYVSSLLWTAAPWSWTIGTMNTVALTANVTDYVVSSPPADLLYINKANVSDGSLTNELKIVSALPASITQIGVPSQVAWLTASSSVRISPKPPTSYSQTLTMLYKKQPVKITVSNYGTAGSLVFPDCYFPVYQEGVLWQSYLYSDDPRAGGVTVDGEGKRQYTGQLGVFQAMIAEMRQSEKMLLDYPQVPILHG